MRLDQSSMDVSTLVEKVRNNEIDLQPGFQRGEVWSDAKKRRLIDTILRQWYIPAIHIVVNDELDKEEILDGQQRLRAIISFMSDEFSIDGGMQPEDDQIASLNGTYYSQLPDRIRSKFRRFPITTVRLRDYKPEEPGELFFRLNQLTALTAAEQRNALIGTPRNQIRELVKTLEDSIKGHEIGFSNARMNFDDTISRLAVTLELGSLLDQISSIRLERRYRSGDPFPYKVVNSIRLSLHRLAYILKNYETRTRLNKASLFSWLYFLIENDFVSDGNEELLIAEYFRIFETTRSGSKRPTVHKGQSLKSFETSSRPAAFNQALAIFNDRASSRINDVSSVLLRDLCLTAGLVTLYPNALELSSRLQLRKTAIHFAIDKLAKIPTDVAERSMAESQLAKQWETRSAHS